MASHDRRADQRAHASRPRSARSPSSCVTSQASPAPSATPAPASPWSRWRGPSRSPRSPVSSSSRPLIVTCPTGTMAGQLADDLRQFLPADEVVQFPGWETLPFERVSPSVETMGQRLEVLWRLRDPERVPAVIVTGVRALLQKLGPGSDHRRSGHRASRRRDRPRPAVGDARRVRVPPRGARRASWRVRPPRRDHRRLPVDRRRPDPHRPVGRRGRPADHVRRQRPALDRRHRRGHDLPRPRADADRRRARASGRPRGERTVGPRAVGAPRRGRALRRHGELAAVVGGRLAGGRRPAPDRRAARRRPSCCSSSRAGCATARSISSPRRTTSPGRWRRRGPAIPIGPFPRLHADPDTLLSGTNAFWSIDSTPESPDTPLVEASGWGPVAGDGTGLTDRLTELIGRGFRVVVAADGAGSATRLRDLLLGNGLDFPVLSTQAANEVRKAGGSIVVAPLHRGCTLPNAKVSIVAESDLTGRRRAHRTARPRKRADGREHVRRPQGRQLRRAPPARRRQVRGHGQAGDRRRRARLPAHLVQGRRQALRAERPDRHAAPVRRWRGAGAAPPRWVRLRQDEEPRPLGRARDRPGTRRALPEAGQRRRPLLRPGHAVAGRDGRGVPVRRDARPAHGDRRHQARHGAGPPDGPPGVRRRRLRQDRGRHPRRVQGDPGRQAGRRARPDHAARHAARQHVRRPVLRLPDPRRGAVPLPHHGAGEEGHRRGQDGRGRLHHRHPPPARQRREVQGPRSADRRRGAAVRRAAQGDDEEDEDERRRPHALRHPDPPHAGDVARRHPRPVAAADAARRPPADPHLRRRVRRARRHRGDPPRAAP